MTSPFRDLKLVVLDCPYDTWNQELTRQFFLQEVSLKFAGYKGEYPYGVLPVDTSDFVAVHVLVCRDEGGKLTPLMGYRSITDTRCQAHGLPFPAVTLCRMAGAPVHERLVQAIVEASRKRGEEVAYDSTFTMDPATKGDRPLRELLKDILIACQYLHKVENQVVETICGGTIRFKTDQYFKRIGYEPLTAPSGEILPPIQVANLLGEDVRVMRLREFPEEALRLGDAWKFFWRSRLQIDAPEALRELNLKRKAA